MPTQQALPGSTPVSAVTARGRQRVRVVLACLVAAAVVVAALPSDATKTGLGTTSAQAVPRARCAPGDLRELGVQGRVSLADRNNGRSLKGYRCNLERIGHFQGEGSSWVSQSYRDCAYMSTRSTNSSAHPGVQVLDVRDPRHPRRVGALRDPAMLGPWETLKINHRRGLLAAVSALDPIGVGAAAFAVYDIGTNCRRPRLLNGIAGTSVPIPANGLGHEGDWSPDGRTYWATSAYLGSITAIDVADPSRPRIIFQGRTSVVNHGLSLSPDGRRLYIAANGDPAGGVLERGNGVQVFDVSSIQDRDPNPRMRLLGEERWRDGAAGQHAISVTFDGRPHIVFADEMASGAVRVLDVADPRQPVVISRIRLAIHLPEHADLRERDVPATSVPFGYDAHYCAVDRARDPRRLACGFFESGVRVFDIADPRRPREIAYYNPPAQTGRELRLSGSQHAYKGTVRTEWCTSPPRFVGRSQLWVACQDNGFMVLRFTGAVAR